MASLGNLSNENREITITSMKMMNSDGGEEDDDDEFEYAELLLKDMANDGSSHEDQQVVCSVQSLLPLD